MSHDETLGGVGALAKRRDSGILARLEKNELAKVLQEKGEGRERGFGEKNDEVEIGLWEKKSGCEKREKWQETEK